MSHLRLALSFTALILNGSHTRWHCITWACREGTDLCIRFSSTMCPQETRHQFLASLLSLRPVYVWNSVIPANHLGCCQLWLVLTLFGLALKKVLFNSHLVILPLDLLSSCLLHGWKMLKIEHSRRGYCVGADRFTESWSMSCILRSTRFWKDLCLLMSSWPHTQELLFWAKKRLSLG